MNSEELRVFKQTIREAVRDGVLDAHRKLHEVHVDNRDDTSEAFYTWLVKECKRTH